MTSEMLGAVVLVLCTTTTLTATITGSGSVDKYEGTYRYYALRVLGLIDKSNTIVQVSEVWLYAVVNGKEVKLNNENVAKELSTDSEGFDQPQNKDKTILASNPSGNNPWSEGPDMLVDGKIDTKWLQFGFHDESEVILEFKEPTHITHIQLVTANDEPGRDPMKFLFAASNDKKQWITVLNVPDFKSPEPRKKATTKWALGFVLPDPVTAYSPSLTTVDTPTKIMFKGGQGGESVKLIQSSKDCTIDGIEAQTSGFTNSVTATVTLMNSGVYNVCYKAMGDDQYKVIYSTKHGNLHVLDKPKARIAINILG